MKLVRKNTIILFMAALLLAPWRLVIAEPLALRVVTERMPPYNYQDKNDELVGVGTVVTKALLEQLALDSKIEIMPWARAYRLALNEPNILIYSIAKTPAREKLFHWLGGYTTIDMNLFAIDNGTGQQGFNIKRLTNKNIGVLRDSSLADYIRRHEDLGRANISKAVSYELLYKMQQRNRLDFILAPKMIVSYFDDKYGTDPKNHPKPVYRMPDPYQLEIHLALSLTTPEATVKRVRQAMAQLRESGKLDKIVSEYRFRQFSFEPLTSHNQIR